LRVQASVVMDALDHRIVAALAETTRPNVLDLSRRLGVARNTVQSRLDHLQRGGVISGYEPVLHLPALGYQVLAFSTLEIVQGSEQRVLDGLAEIPEIVEAHKITGPGDVLVRIVARTNDHLNDVLERVLSLPGIARTTTSLALTSHVERMHVNAETSLSLSSLSS
jgi:DNA-binding Lrp family transcriptional regulator